MAQFMMVQLMAGTRRLAQAFAGARAEARSFEIADTPDEDVLSTPMPSWLRRAIDGRRANFVWAGLPCATWPRARRKRTGRPGWPRPLREPAALWGVDHLSPTESARVEEANRQARFVLGAFKRCLHAGITMVIENPRTSLLWLLPAVKALAQHSAVRVIDFDMCGSGSSWKKPTKLLVCNGDLSIVASRRCSGRCGVCDFSRVPHAHLTRRGSVSFKTKSAQEYPVGLCQTIANTALRRCCSHPPGPSA